MKISLAGVLSRAIEALQTGKDAVGRRYTAEDKRGYAFMLEELHKHLKQLANDHGRLSEFLELWCVNKEETAA